MKRSFIAAALILGLAVSAKAQDPTGWRPMITWSMRQLTVGSDVVVLASPAGPGAPDRFKAVRVLLGTALKSGDQFEIDDMSDYDLTAPESAGASKRKPVKVGEALMFLKAKKGGAPAGPFSLVSSGLRLAVIDGPVYYPKQEGQSNGFTLQSYSSDVQWDELVRRAAADAAEVNGVRSFHAMSDPHRRNLALLDWAERRRRDFGGGWYLEDGREPAAGWGSLEGAVFTWVLDSRIPADCWAAVRVYAELNHGSNPELKTPAFGTRAGRDLLLSVALDGQSLLGHRIRAVELLGQSATLWPSKMAGQPEVEPLDDKEQAALIDNLVSSLKESDPGLRAEAAGTILEASVPTGDEWKALHTQRALTALTAAYQNQAPGRTRNALAQAIGGIGSIDQWKELTGNAHGVIATLEDPGLQQTGEAYCWLVVRRTQEKVDDAQTLLLERLDDKQAVVEKKEVKLDPKTSPANSGPTYKGGTDPSAVYWRFFSFSMRDFTPGVWRMTVKGVAGDDKAPWTSEPRILHLAPPPKPEAANTNPTAPRIVFDP